MTVVILSPPRTSTSGRAPVFSATIRFWISVDSLNRPPTLLTIPSSFSSSSIVTPRSGVVRELFADQLFEFAHRGVQVAVHDHRVDLALPGEFALGGLQPPQD